METDAQLRRDPNPALFGEISLNPDHLQNETHLHEARVNSKQHKSLPY
ncbi:Uncharacterised protein [Streptococcus pneumoniae]|nr:Uncharacterised protein [Streptococcus pneumoniae]CIV85714.1 Uncharacterised protein [Streptococcus pneumoniae]CJG76078.1 Uncharacterised protein [Streptococcus pneumoniae]